jgi:hypothetical protein
MKYITDGFSLPITLFIRDYKDGMVKDISGFLKIVDCSKNHIVIKLFNKGEHRYVTFDEIVFITKFDEFEILDENMITPALISAIENHSINTSGLRKILKDTGIA